MLRGYLTLSHQGSSGFPTRSDSNWPAQLETSYGLGIVTVASVVIILSRQRTAKALIRLRGCAG